jgi:2-deoxy-D-gluconate 3-dehydrogenase
LLEQFGSEVEKAVKSTGRNFKAYVCNFGNRKALYAFIGKVKTDYPVIDILINNAGTVKRKAAIEHPDDYWDETIEINLSSHFILTREIGKDMVSRGSGKIIFTASMLSFQGGIHVPGYAASKGAIATLTKAFANEWAGRGVNVNAIAPGYILTSMTDDIYNDPVRSRTILERIPAGRWGEPDDLKGAIVFLASGASNYVNGTILNVDGGWLGR